MKYTDVNLSTCVDFDVESNDKDPKFKVCDQVRITKQKNIFVKCYTLNWSEEDFITKKL